MSRIDDYRAVAGPGAVDFILKLAERVKARRFLHVTGGRLGGGVAETLRAVVPLLSELGIDARWEITGGDSAYYATARALQAALEGVERVLSEEGLARWADMNRRNGKKLDLDADLTLVHDSQPASLVSVRTTGRWVWRCHFDCSPAQAGTWSLFRQFADQYDAAVFALPGFEGRLGIPMYVIPPSIDPLSERNRDLPAREVTEILAGLGVARDKPLLVQIGPFARAHDPLGVVNAYRLVEKHHDVRLVLAGTADDEPERLELLSQLREVAHEDPDVVVLELPAEAHRQINALQRAATIVLQKSVRGGFDLGPAEAMWKGKPVVGGSTGGLAQQIIPNVTGYTVYSVEGAAFRIRHLLNNPELIPRMGAAGREHVRRSFLITRELLDDLALAVHLPR
ncbi:MAG: glycosyl transferase family 1 [Candidatus Rokuibacteriota bacterium]|nr:MAG: glycosyl transferase family 1 [Candidatus Rokubacteria bacterium]